MNYHEAREFISSLSVRGITPGLATVSALCQRLGNPQNEFKTIHIAGTNGKGSTGAFLESILRAENKSVCRFVSPAVGDYLESFTYNGSPVSETLYAECVNAVKSVISSDISPSSFEAETAVAFLIFKKLAPDYSIIECGMGGKLDSTNILSSPKLCIITSISLDHTAFLGDTIEKITAQKCGIIKKDGTVVTSSSHSDGIKSIINQACNENNARLYYAAPHSEKYFTDKTEFNFEDNTYEISLLGAYQPQNAALSIKAAQLLGIDNKTIKKGLKTAVWQYRFERVGKYILDGAHNADAAKRLAESIMHTLKNKRTAYICGCFKDKDYTAIAQMTAPFANTVYCITPPSPRGLDNSVLCEAFQNAGAKACCANSLSEALLLTKDYDAVVIFGSLSYLGEAKSLIEGTYNNAKMQ